MTEILLRHLFDCTETGGMFVAESVDGERHHIDDVASGLACDCLCPSCRRQMVAKKGKVQTHHFAHHTQPDGTTCSSAGETILHRFAKAVLEHALTIKLPALVVEERDDREVVVEPHNRAFDRATLETRTGEIVPDVVLEAKDRKLIVEFKVTHACSEDKVAQIRQMDVGAIEVDLSGYRDTPLVDLAESILFKAPRVWLHNPRENDAKKQLADRRAQRENSLEHRLEIFRGSYRQIWPAKRPGTGHYEIWARQCGLDDAINLPIKGAGCFAVPLAEWQAAVIFDLYGPGKNHYRTANAFKELKYRGWVNEAYLDLDSELSRALVFSDIQYAPPRAALESYLKELCHIGYLDLNFSTDVWKPTYRLAERLETNERVRMRPELRLSRMKQVVKQQLEGLPGNEISEFDFRDWVRRTLPGHRFSIMHAINLNDSDWDPLIREISNLRKAIGENPDPEMPLLGLPLSGELKRSLEQADH